MKKQIFFFAFMFILLIASVQAESFKIDSPGELRIGCDVLNCSSDYNITVTYPNSSIFIDNNITTQLNGYVLYSFDSFSQIGDYDYYLFSEFGDEHSGLFTVTQSGTTPSFAQSLIYGTIFLFALVIFLSLFVPGLMIDASRKTNIQGLVEWNGRIYLKMFLLMISDLAFVFLTFITWRMAYYFLPVDFVSDILRSLFLVNLILAPIVIIVGGIIVYVLILFDKNARDLMSRGIDPNEYRK